MTTSTDEKTKVSVSQNYISRLEGDTLWRYGSGLAMYVERLRDGRLIGASFRDNGIPVNAYDEDANTPAFGLVIDGQEMSYDWAFVNFEVREERAGAVVGTLTLRHAFKPVELTVKTRCGGHGFFKRELAITNTSAAETMSLTSVTPLTGRLWPMVDCLRENLRGNTAVPYSVGRCKDFFWGNEGNFDWQDIPLSTKISYEASEGKSGYSSPFFVLRNNLYGGYFIGQLAWSSGWEADFFCDFRNPAFSDTRVSLRFGLRPAGPPPMRLIGPGETVTVPAMHFGMAQADFDTVIQNLHAYQRESVLRRPAGGVQPVFYNHFGYVGEELSEEKLKAEVDIAAELGAEVFIVDAGWFGDVGTTWGPTVGDWKAKGRLPNDLFGTFDHARSKGLKCGLWVEIESAGDQCQLVKDHPDWLITRFGQRVGRILDLSKPEVVAHLESEVVRLIERYKLDLFRIDYNSFHIEQGGYNRRDGWSENTLWRHVESLYGIFDRVIARYPNLLMENCAGGGGRNDVGMLSRFTACQSSDWFRMPRTVRILNGMTMVLPPEHGGRIMGACMNASYRGSLDALMHSTIMAHPTLSGITPGLAEANPAAMACIKKYLGIYKEFLRSFMHHARVYHHTPVIPGGDGEGWCALEYAAPDGRAGYAGVFKFLGGSQIYQLRFRGARRNKNYRVTWFGSGQTAEVSGLALSGGLDIALDGALSSELILYEAVN